MPSPIPPVALGAGPGLQLNFTPFPTLTTERLLLRRLTLADAPALFTMRADPQVMQYIPRPLAQTVAETAQYIEVVNESARENERLTWGMALRDDPAQVIGTIGFVSFKPEHFRAEVGYLLHTGWQGQGLMREALAAVVAFGFQQLGLHSIEAVLDPANAASARLLERCGFVREGLFRENEYYNGKFLDSAYYSLLTAGTH
jgi:ribosomal-protein-alanine N-acetyltransferase